VFHDVGAEHAVERRVWKRRAGGVGDQDSRCPRGGCGHAGDVDVAGDDLGSRLGEHRRKPTGAATQVEHACSGDREGERGDGARRQRASERLGIRARAQEQTNQVTAARAGPFDVLVLSVRAHGANDAIRAGCRRRL
jgi:hypothetical protein